MDRSWVTGFGPFNLPTYDLLPKGWDHSQKFVKSGLVLQKLSPPFFVVFGNVRHVHYCWLRGALLFINYTTRVFT